MASASQPPPPLRRVNTKFKGTWREDTLHKLREATVVIRAVQETLVKLLFTRRHALVAALSFLSGTANVCSLLAFEAFGNIMTGNTIACGRALAEGRPADAAFFASAVVAYVCGAFAAKALLGIAPAYDTLLGAIISLVLNGLCSLVWATTDSRYAMLCLATALGLVNTMTMKVDGIVTQMVTNHYVTVAGESLDLLRNGCRTPIKQRVQLCVSAGVIFWFAAGVVTSQALMSYVFDDSPPKATFLVLGVAFAALLWLHRQHEAINAAKVKARNTAAIAAAACIRRASRISSLFLANRMVPATMAGTGLEPRKSAVLMIEMQNDFASPGGKFYDRVSEGVDAHRMMPNCASLCRRARLVGAPVLHAPIYFGSDADGNNNRNPLVGILKGVHEQQAFLAGSWGADFHPDLAPANGETTVQNKHGLDCFIGTDLEGLLAELGIETIILGGFLTNVCVESTMRHGYELGYNVITLVDGAACFSVAEHKAAVDGTFKMFSTPMRCSEAAELLEKWRPAAGPALRWEGQDREFCETEI